MLSSIGRLRSSYIHASWPKKTSVFYPGYFNTDYDDDPPFLSYCLFASKEAKTQMNFRQDSWCGICYP
ncbi:hypothetical protein NC652_029891 [Populus alba x Populus x berolinensis]|nr:hypothetical protein NC652_029891 [Populus alba x Populus x berolinensis]